MTLVSIRSCVLLVAICCACAAGCSSARGQATASAQAESSQPVSADPAVNAILESSCFTCHSTGAKAPWYAAVSPTYLAANAARAALNFSDWQAYDPARRSEEMRKIAESVRSGSMPPGDYTALDHSA